MPKPGDVVLVSNRVHDFPWDHSLEQYYGHLGVITEESYGQVRVHVPTVHDPEGSSLFFPDELTVMVEA